MMLLSIVILYEVSLVMVVTASVWDGPATAWDEVACDTHFEPKNCDLEKIRIIPRMLQGLTSIDMKTTVLGQEVDFPIALSPVALQTLADPEGEMATATAVEDMKTIMILSSFSSTLIEDLAPIIQNSTSHYWMQLYIFEDRTLTTDIMRKAEEAGFKAFVLTADAPTHASLTCSGRKSVVDIEGVRLVNMPDGKVPSVNSSLSYDDITWLTEQTELPIVVKGILKGEDATKAILAGASAILVSNHGGRQVDGDPATIDVLPGVVEAVNKLDPSKEVYIDGGIRSGSDVFKALARGAKVAFVGRPVIWGLTIGGSKGVKKMLTILKSELREMMFMSGVPTLSDLTEDLIATFDSVVHYQKTNSLSEKDEEED
ncbi:hydroxyacid oxidase 1-like isoform X2 [Stegodyphus dumicola]|uniref:hydroxyacid oxidase 1-like isoform X2 n=1 Tax=Stegodyphus dumicola TaxID=202533 RepID=UPI0015AB6D19|nr:hydroxyacid oxidase 1-like isoform X2 [Stegodyphus dumicola]